MFKFEKIFRTDITLTLIILMISLVGLINIFATTFYPELRASELFYNQILYTILGFAIYFGITAFNYKLIKNLYLTFGIFVVTIGLLVLVLQIGIELYGAKRWIEVGSFLLQPSEFAKLSLIVIFAYVYRNVDEKRKNKTKKDTRNKFEKFKEFLFTPQFYRLSAVGVVWLSFAILIMRQNSLGNTLLLTGILGLLFLCIFKLDRKTISYICIGLLWILAGFELLVLKDSGSFYLKTEYINIDIFVIGILMIFSIYLFLKFKLNLFFVLAIILLSLGSKVMLDYSYNNVLKDYQRARVESFVNPSNELAQNANWNREQSLTAIGSSTVLGKGFLNGTQSNYKFLPFSYTDFAYASFVEQFGTPGSMFLLGLYFAFCARLIWITNFLKHNYEKLIIYGCVFLVLLNTIQHVGMNLGLLPITGVPLPLVSYGGSSTLVIFIALGLVNSIYTDPTNKLAKVIKMNSKPSASYYKRRNLTKQLSANSNLLSS